MRIPLLSLAVLVVGTSTSLAHAAGGLFSGNKGAHASGRAGAFTARADDLTAPHYNPAGLSRLKAPLLQVGDRISYNQQEYTRAATTDWNAAGAPVVSFEPVRNGKPWWGLDPFVGFGTRLGLEHWAFALAVYGPPGVAVQDFPVNGGQRYMMVNREALILNYTATAAWSPNDKFGLGASFQWIDVSLLKYSLVLDGNPIGTDARPVSSGLDMLATTEGSDHFTPNAVLGAWVRLSPQLELGIAGQVIPANIVTKSKLEVEPLGSGFTTGVELSRNYRPADDVELTIPLPLSARAGIRYVKAQDQQEKFDVELDLTYETWSRVDRFKLDSNGMVAEFIGQRLDVGVIELQKQWQDTFSVHLGSDVAVSPDLLTLRGGVFFESAVAQRSYMNVDFVSGPQLGGALGASVFAGPVEVAVAYNFRQQTKVSLAENDAQVYQTVPFSRCEAPYTDPATCNEHYYGQPAPAVNAGEYRAHSHVLAMDALVRF